MQDRRTVAGPVRGAAAAVATLALAAATFTAAPAAAAPAPAGADRIATGWDGPSPLARLLARQTLPDGDGWGSAGAGTTGGAAATPDQVHVVSTRAELIDALGGDNATNGRNDTPKIVFINGTINGFEGPDGQLLSCDDLADPGYDLEAYLAAYDPEVWGRDREPEGPLEEARQRSVDNQRAQTVINVGGNTTLYGINGARLKNLTLMFDRVDNVIVRNITFEDAFDCFPQWDPTDGALGNWNSEWDNVSVRRGSNFWFDHNTFTDGDNPDSELPRYFGRLFQVHDGALDITHTADLVTVSHNVFTNHDKTMLIGSTNNPGGGDPGRLNVTLHHNLFNGVVQRAPRVRFGRVDVYNNYYRIPVADPYEYSWGVGVESMTYAENNFLELGAGVDPARVIGEFDGTAIAEHGTWARLGNGVPRPVSMLDAYNAANDPDLGDDVGWVPELRRGPVLPAVAVPVVVSLSAGAGRLPS
ncbi:MAG: pectate lyase [Micromonosporaceae bacterium]